MAIGGLVKGISRLPWEQLGAALRRAPEPSLTSRGNHRIAPTAFHSYDVGRPQRISFGVEPQFNPEHLQVTPMARNPFALSRTNPVSRQGEELADLYESATGAYQGPVTDIDALMYWIGRGNPEAMETLSRIAARGPAPSTARPISSLGREMDDIFLTHATRFRPEMRGNDVFIRPMGDFNPDFPWRHTVHFAGQHRVQPVVGMGRQHSWDDAPYTVIARINDILEANPRALNNLNIDDTFFTPRFNQPLRIPNARVIEGDKFAAARGIEDYAQSIGARNVFEAENALQEFARRSGARYGMDFESPAWRYGMDGYASPGMIRDSGFGRAITGDKYWGGMSANLRERILGQGRLSGMFDYYNPWLDTFNF